MSKYTKSRYAKKLRQLGFRPIDKKLSLEVRAVVPKKLSRNERRQLEKKRYRPWFTNADIVTFATDETGQTWQGPPNTDLSHMGFDDRSSALSGQTYH